MSPSLATILGAPRRATAILALVLATAGGCVDRSETTQSLARWSQTTDADGVLAYGPGLDSCEDCIEITEVARFGGGDSPGYLVETGREFGTVVDHLNRYWVPQPAGAIQVYAEDGTYLRAVGRRGQGPMDFEHHWLSHVDEEGSVHVLDPVNRRESVISSDFELLRTRPLPTFFLRSVALADGRHVIQSPTAATGEVGALLHIWDGQEVVRSFGSPGVDPDQASPSALGYYSRRHLALGHDGIIYSTEEAQRETEAWDQEGNRLTGFSGPTLNLAPPLPTPFSRENPFIHVIKATMVDEDRRLWLALFMLRPNWQDNIEERVGQDGTVYQFPIGGTFSDVYFTRIEVVDLDSQTIIASQETEGLLSTFLPGRRAVAVIHRPDGNMELAVWRLGEPGKRE